jgi:glutamate carboxypeptidase
MWFLFVLLLAGRSVQGQVLSGTEVEIIKSIEANMPSAINLLEESVNINSGTFNLQGVKRVGELYAKELTALGFTTLWINMPEKMKRAGHLVAYRKGNRGKKLFLVGHLDTVFEPDMPANPLQR